LLLVAAGLFVQSFREIASRPLGFQPDQVTIVTIDMSRTAIAADARSLEDGSRRSAHRSSPGET
jgi:hypothetical protein